MSTVYHIVFCFIYTFNTSLFGRSLGRVKIMASMISMADMPVQGVHDGLIESRFNSCRMAAMHQTLFHEVIL